MIHYYRKGQRVRATCTFAVAGVATDPSTITARVMSPARVVTSYVYGVNAELVRDGVGVYHIDVSTTASGEYKTRFEGTGACQAVEENTFGTNSAFP